MGKWPRVQRVRLLRVAFTAGRRSQTALAFKTYAEAPVARALILSSTSTSCVRKIIFEAGMFA